VKQQAVFGSLTRRWRALTNEQRASWRALAKNLSRTNRLGQTAPPSGYQLYIKVNLYTAWWADNPLSWPPTIDNRMTFDNVTIAATAPATAAAKLFLSLADEPLQIQVMGFRPFSQTLPKHQSPWREVYNDRHGPAATVTAVFGPGWNDVYGDLVAGEAIAIRVRVLNIASQLLPSPPLARDTIVLAP